MYLFFFILAILAGFQPLALADQDQQRPFAVVELFSSQGCSDCPAAELVASKLTAWARQNDEPVYPMVFHVDYWNDEGWRDVFSDHRFTQRQSDYSRVLQNQQVYTPEMIINGTDAFVGSDQDHLQKALDHELSVPTGVILRIDLSRHDGQIDVHYTSSGFTDGDVVNFALVERGLSTDVTAGENAGRTLYHDNVVREFVTKSIQPSGHAVISLRKIFDLSQASVIVFVQNPLTMLIEAAQQTDLEND